MAMTQKQKKLMTRPVLCSVCSATGHTLVKDGKDGYKHQNPAICAQVKRESRTQSKRQITVPSIREVMKYAE